MHQLLCQTRFLMQTIIFCCYRLEQKGLLKRIKVMLIMTDFMIM